MLPEKHYYTTSLYDHLHPKPIDNRTGEEIAKEIIEKAGITIVE